jgi:hypothetical protein
MALAAIATASEPCPVARASVPVIVAPLRPMRSASSPPSRRSVDVTIPSSVTSRTGASTSSRVKDIEARQVVATRSDVQPTGGESMAGAIATPPADCATESARVEPPATGRISSSPGATGFSVYGVPTAAAEATGIRPAAAIAAAIMRRGLSIGPPPSRPGAGR